MCESSSALIRGSTLIRCVASRRHAESTQIPHRSLRYCSIHLARIHCQVSSLARFRCVVPILRCKFNLHYHISYRPPLRGERQVQCPLPQCSCLLDGGLQEAGSCLESVSQTPFPSLFRGQLRWVKSERFDHVTRSSGEGLFTPVLSLVRLCLLRVFGVPIPSRWGPVVHD